MTFSKTVLDINPSLEILRISDFIREMTFKNLKRKGAVVGLSGGVDSAVVSELCVNALGKDRVLGLLLPEKESNPISLEYGQKQADKLGIKTIKIDITKYLESLKIYETRNRVIKRNFPEHNGPIKFHVTLPQNLLEKNRINYYSITVENKDGTRQKQRISGADWLSISACQNIKQRMRMIQLYYYSEKNNYMVAGTTNKSEIMQGFYVKYGDGGVDIEPIGHLYKTQVYKLAENLDVIDEIINRPPSPDTYSLPVTDKEFYFCLDYKLLDSLLYAYENSVPSDQISSTLDLEEEQIERVFRDFKAKGRATWHLREMPPSLDAFIKSDKTILR